MERPKDTIVNKTILGLVALLCFSVFAPTPTFATNTTIITEVCNTSNAEPVISSNIRDGEVVFASPVTMNFTGSWIHSYTIKHNSAVLNSQNLSFSAGQNFSQNINLINGINIITLEINGGCPRHNVVGTTRINYQPNGITVNPVTTSESSPALGGKLGNNNHKIKVTVNGQTYDAVNNGNGTWNLPAGTISPALANGTYDVTVQLLDRNTNAVLNSVTETGALVISGFAPVVKVNKTITNETSPFLDGTINSPTHKVQIVVNGQTYDAVNDGDGNWHLPPNTISPALVDGTYDIVVNALDPVTNAIVSTDTLSNGLTVDTQAPVFAVDSPKETNSRQPEFRGRIDDPTAVIGITINGRTYDAVNNGDGTWSLPAGVIASLASGKYKVDVGAIDRAGNLTEYSFELVIKAKNEIGFILAPATGYLRIENTNIPSWLMYLALIMIASGIFLTVKNRKDSKSTL